MSPVKKSSTEKTSVTFTVGKQLITNLSRGQREAYSNYPRDCQEAYNRFKTGLENQFVVLNLERKTVINPE